MSYDPIAKAKANPKSLRAAINGKCWDCVGADADPNPRGRIRDCTSEATCTLWPLRPYRGDISSLESDQDTMIPEEG